MIIFKSRICGSALSWCFKNTGVQIEAYSNRGHGQIVKCFGYSFTGISKILIGNIQREFYEVSL